MTFGIVGNISKPVTREVTTRLLTYFRTRGHAFVVHEELGSWYNAGSPETPIEQQRRRGSAALPKECDILVALGGDGTMLAAARMVGPIGTPLLGINVGKLGFLAEVSVDEIETVLEEIARGAYVVEDRTVLTVRRSGDDEALCALNEVVVDKGQAARVIELETFVNGEYLVTYAADGIIVTTPTGSTAYSLASGGPIVAPASKVLAIIPVAPHTLTARPVVVPDDGVIKLVVAAQGRPVHLTADGQIERYVDTPAEFEIRKAGYSVKLVKRKQRTYFDLLRTKLLWGRDLRLRTHT